MTSGSLPSTYRSPLARAAFGVALGLGLSLSLLSPAATASDATWKLGLGAGYEHLGDGGGSGLGGSGRVTYVASDALLLLGELGAGYHPGSERTSSSVWVGTAYVVDVLTWVPYLGVGAGLWGLGQGGPCGGQAEPRCFETRPGVTLPYGLDYRLSPDLSLGAAGQTRLLFGGTGGAGSTTTATSVQGRVEFTWGQ